MPRITLREAARRDLVDQYIYLAENAGETVADRFLNFSAILAATKGRKPSVVHFALKTLAHPRSSSKWSPR